MVNRYIYIFLYNIKYCLWNSLYICMNIKNILQLLMYILCSILGFIHQNNIICSLEIYVRFGWMNKVFTLVTEEFLLQLLSMF